MNKCACGAEIVSDTWKALDLANKVMEISAFTCNTDGCSGNVKQIHERMVKMESLQPHQRRVVEEKRDLDAKIDKLWAFTGGSICGNLSRDELDRLSRQYRYMKEYSGVLGERIAAF